MHSSASETIVSTTSLHVGISLIKPTTYRDNRIGAMGKAATATVIVVSTRVCIQDGPVQTRFHGRIEPFARW